jgi:hypothetical protein
MSVTITSIAGGDAIGASRSTLNTNFSNLKTAVEASQSDITALQSADTSLDSRIDALEAAGSGGALGALWTLTPPVSSAFSWVNQSTATVSDNPSSMIISVPSSGSANLRCLVKSVPSTPYTLTALVYPGLANTFPAIAGICLRESSSGKLSSIHFLYNSTLQIEANKWNSATSWNSSMASVSSQYQGYHRCFFRIADDGTTITFSYSYNGLYFQQLTTLGHTAWGTPDQMGMFVDVENSISGQKAAFGHFSTSTLAAA